MSGFQSKRDAAADKLQEPEREALRLALEALEEAWYHVGTFQPTEKAIDLYDEARTAIKAALAQPAQEPVADRLERLLWEYIDLQAAHPEHRPNPKTWHHLMTYAPLPAQEPAAWANMRDDGVTPVMLSISQHPEDRANWMNPVPLYTAPPKREWVGLIDTDIGDEFVRFQIKGGFTQFEYAVRAIEAKLKEKNNGT
jgi:hypothetical protein